MPPESTREQRLALPVRTAHGPAALQRLAQWLDDELVAAPLVSVVHASALRLKALGLFMLVGHPLAWWVASAGLPQPYENLPLRLAAALLGLALWHPRVAGEPTSRFAGQVFGSVCWFELPLFCSWMFWCNGGNGVWLAGMAAMILLYYSLTDWRLATLGLAAGMALTRILFELAGPAVAPMTGERVLTDTFVLAGCTGMGLLLAVTSPNLRRDQLQQTLSAVGVVAHELRTPLATVALIGDAVRGSAGTVDLETGERLQQLASRLHAMVRNMNHQIDLRIANARLMRLTHHKESISAAHLVRTAASHFPYRSTRERECVVVRVGQDFRFDGSQILFLQVIDNLMKNALRSLAAASNAAQPGDLVIDVLCDGDRGRIVVTDRGVGIAPAILPRIFEPFFSTDRSTGHGLGLAFCRRVVLGAGGSIRVQSEPGAGAAFTVDLPARR